MSDAAALKFGDPCRARCTAPARYLGGGRCLYVSAMCNELSEDEARPPDGDETRFPLPGDDDLTTWLARHGGGGTKQE